MSSDSTTPSSQPVFIPPFIPPAERATVVGAARDCLGWLRKQNLSMFVRPRALWGRKKYGPVLETSNGTWAPFSTTTTT